MANSYSNTLQHAGTSAAYQRALLGHPPAKNRLKSAGAAGRRAPQGGRILSGKSNQSKNNQYM